MLSHFFGKDFQSNTVYWLVFNIAYVYAYIAYIYTYVCIYIYLYLIMRVALLLLTFIITKQLREMGSEKYP